MRKALSILGFLLAALGAFALWAEFSPVAAVADTRAAGLGLAGAAAAVFVLLVASGRGSQLARVGLVLALATAGAAVKLLWFTYREVELAFESEGVILRGTLFAPRQGGPSPAVVYLHGSGQLPREEGFYVAKLFARHGIAGFAYDKRGAGESGGARRPAPYETYAADAVAAIQALAARPDIDARRIGVIGQSEGGWVAPLVVERWPATAFVILTSSTHLSPAEQVAYESGASVLAAGFGEEQARGARMLMIRALAFDRSGEDEAALNTDLAAAARAPWFEASDLPPNVSRSTDVTWWRSVMDFDPVPHWRRVTCPVLIVSGGRDLKSDATASQEGLARALAEGGNTQVTRRIFSSMEHGTIEWWLPGRLPPPRFPAGYPELLIEWTKAQVHRRG